MIHLWTYVIVLFTIQLHMVHQGTPAVLINTIWCFVFVMIVVFRKKLTYMDDHPYVQYRKQMIAVWCMALLFLIASNMYTDHAINDTRNSSIERLLQTKIEGEVAADGVADVYELKGSIQSPVTIDGDRASFIVSATHVNNVPLQKQESLVVSRYMNQSSEIALYETLQRGDFWEGTVTLSKPSVARTPGAFDYRQFLLQQGIHYTAIIQENDWTTYVNRSLTISVFHLLDRQRTNWIKQTERLYSEEVAAIVQAMTVGYRDNVNPDLLNMYQELGIIHLLAISGLHVGIILAFLYFILSRFPLTKEAIYDMLLVFIPIYIYISGAQVSVIRSGLMAMVVILFLRFQWQKHALIGLYIVYVVMLYYDPFYLYHIGFQLSFSVTFALLTVHPYMVRLMTFLPDKLAQLISVALVAQLVTIPLILFHFYQFSPISLLLNVVLVPLYSLIYIPGAFFITGFSFIHGETVELFARVYEWSFSLLHTWLFQLQKLSWATVATGQPSFWWIVVYFVVVISVIVSAERGKRRRAWMLLSVIPLLICIQLALPYFDRQAYVTMLDVGQGEAIVIELPFREQVLMVDVGGQFQFSSEAWRQRRRSFDVGEHIVLPYLRYRGINTIDKIIISHGHYDHYGGLAGLVDKVKINQILYSPVLPQSVTEEQTIQSLIEHNVPIYKAGQGDFWTTEHASFVVVYPHQQNEWVAQTNNIHDYNLVVWNEIYDTSFLWTGDVEVSGEEIIMADYPHLAVDFLKIAHHGSTTSTGEQWLQHIQPEVALISAGRWNRYGHPHPSIVSRLEVNDIDIYRTDKHGTIVITITPQGWEIIPTVTEE